LSPGVRGTPFLCRYSSVATARWASSQSCQMPYFNMVSIPARQALRLTPKSGMPATWIIRSALRINPLSSILSRRSTKVAWVSLVGSIIEFPLLPPIIEAQALIACRLGQLPSQTPLGSLHQAKAHFLYRRK